MAMVATLPGHFGARIAAVLGVCVLVLLWALSADGARAAVTGAVRFEEAHGMPRACIYPDFKSVDGGFTWVLCREALRPDRRVGLVRIDPAGHASRLYALPRRFEDGGTVPGRNGAIWFVGQRYACQITARGAGGCVAIPRSAAFPRARNYTAGQAGTPSGSLALLRSASKGDQKDLEDSLVTITADLKTSIQILPPEANVLDPGLVMSSSGELWFGGLTFIGRISATSHVTLFPLAAALNGSDGGSALPAQATPNGDVYFVAGLKEQYLFRVDPEGVQTVVAKAPGNLNTGLTTETSDGAVWELAGKPFNHTVPTLLVRSDPNGEVGRFTLVGHELTELASGPGGELWATEFNETSNHWWLVTINKSGVVTRRRANSRVVFGSGSTLWVAAATARASVPVRLLRVVVR